MINSIICSADINNITVKDRIRKDFSSEIMASMEVSIREHGLLHPITCKKQEGTNKYILVAGETRYRVMKKIIEDAKKDGKAPKIVFNSTEYKDGTVPISLVPIDTTDTELLLLEYMENVERKDFTAVEKMEAAKRLESDTRTVLRSAYNLYREGGEKQAIEMIQNFAALTAGKGGVTAERVESLAGSMQVKGAELVDTRASKQIIVGDADMIIFSELMEMFSLLSVAEANSLMQENPESLFAKVKEAVVAFCQRKKAEIERNFTSSNSKVKVSHQVISADFMDVTSIKEKSVDAIIVDPPYGIDADKQMGHNYDDSLENAIKVLSGIFEKARVWLKEDKYLIIFLPQTLDELLLEKTREARKGFWTLNEPIIFSKGGQGSEISGFIRVRRNYEQCYIFVNGELSSRLPQLKVLPFVNTGVWNFTHNKLDAAEKPQAVLEKLLDFSVTVGDTVLDMCAGSGSLMEAANAAGVNSISIEIDPVRATAIKDRLKRMN